MENREKEKVFIGAKVLSDQQIKLIVPTFDTIKDQIEEMRRQALKSENIGEAQYNNTIGLFGGRGTGKSSTLMTLKKHLVKSEGNIILDTIEPDLFGDNTKIMGAIIGLFEGKVNKLEDDIQKSKEQEHYPEFFYDCKFKKSNPLRKSYQEMLEAYCYSEDEYRSLLTSDFTDFETFKKKYSKVLKPDIELGNSINKFYNQLTDAKRKLMKESKQENTEPMIFIFIDDVDLKTSKCKEVIDSIMKYTCHPNVICILSGDYEILNEAITLSLLEAEKLAGDLSYAKEKLFDDSRNFDGAFSLFDRKKYLTHEYLKKILPPAFRHNVVNWNLDNIPFFSFVSKNEGKEEEVFLYEKFGEVFGEDSLFMPIRKEDKIFLKTPFNLLDKTPRGIVNVYYVLNKFIERRDSTEDFNLFENTKLLIDTIINSSSELVKYQNTIYDKFIIWGADEKSTIINFEEIGEELYKYIKNSKNDIDIPVEVIVSSFLLGCIIKKLLNNILLKEYEDAKEKFIFILCENSRVMNQKFLSGTIDFNSFKSRETWSKNISGNYNNVVLELLLDEKLYENLYFLENIGLSKKDGNMFVDDEEHMRKRKKLDKEIFEIIYEYVRNEADNSTIKRWYKLSKRKNRKFKNVMHLLEKFSNDIRENPVLYRLSINFSVFIMNKEFDMDNRSTIIDIVTNNLMNVYDEEFFSGHKYSNVKIDNTKIDKTIDILNRHNNGEKFDLEMLDDTIKKSMKNIFTEFGNSFLSITRDHKIIGFKNVWGDIREFFEKGLECNKETIYNKTAQIIKKIAEEYFSANEDTIKIDDFLKIMKELKKLSANNRVWYGSWEAYETLRAIRTKAYFYNDFFNKTNREFLTLYMNYIESSDDILRDMNELEKKKTEMRKILKNSLKEVRNSMELEAAKLDKQLYELEGHEEN